MQGPFVNWNMRRHPSTYTRYKENMHWDRNFRPRGQYQSNIQNYDYQHWCETCDKGFATAHLLENHKQQHQKCSIDGCQFVAHPKIITRHIQMQHSTGLFKKIAKLNNPEDIKKWREERRKKYPTMENIKKKEAAIHEKLNRGEKIGMRIERGKRNDRNDFHHRSNQRPSHTDRAKHIQGNFNRNTRKRIATNETKHSHLPKKIFKEVPAILEESRTLKPFAGIQSLAIDENLDKETESETQCSVPIEDDEDEVVNSSDTTIVTSVSEPTVCSALTSLLCCYESSDDDDVETSVQCTTTTILEKPLNKNVRYNYEIKILKDDKVSSPAIQIDTSEKTKCTEKVSNNTDAKSQEAESNVSNCPHVGDDDESGPEEVQISKEDANLPIEDTKIIKTKLTKEFSDKKVCRLSNKTNEFRRRKKLPSTLLEKLLAREIQHERNVILQCVRYVVKNKYFEKANSIPT